MGGTLPSPPPHDRWVTEVTARIRDDAHAFVREGEAFTAGVPGYGITGRFDEQGARLEQEYGVLSAHTTAWGRGDGLDDVSPAAPRLGACIFGAEAPGGDCVQRLEYAHGGLVEWWAGGDDGFEQGWTVVSRPQGAGDLLIHVAIEGTTATMAGDELWLDGDSGGQWLVSGLVAWDADDVPLAARFASSERGFVVAVSDAGAKYPIEVDPVYATANTTLTGTTAGDMFGYSVAGAGDVDGDGFDDVVVGAREYLSSRGRAYIFHGSASGVSSTATTTLTGSASNDYFGSSVAGAGDVNADGYDDVIVGAYGYSTYTGLAYLYQGSSAGVSSTPKTTLTGASASDMFGCSVAGAGDVNGDGYDDVIVGASGYSSYAGRAYVYRGSSSGVASSASTTLTGGATLNEFGSSVAGAGDVNGDGYDDVIVGAWRYSTSVGRAYVYHGSSGGVSSVATTTFTGAGTSYYLGCSVAGAGDVDGDGYDDVIVGAGGYSSYAGRAYVYSGTAAGVSSTATTTLTGPASACWFGYSVASAGDINADGYGDVIVAGPWCSSGTGRAEVHLGSVTGVAGAATNALIGSRSGYYFGLSVSGAGDVNADGYDDVIIGVPGYGSSKYLGSANVHQGCIDADADDICVTDDCDDTDATVGDAVVRYADADGDGYGDASDSATLCPSASGYVATSTDCDDTDVAISPAATEVCDTANTDEDCDGDADNDDRSAAASGKANYYLDADGDGYGSATTGAYCDLPSGYTSTSTDCDDSDSSDHPSATETVGNGDDDDCDGGEICYDDGDDDGYRSESGATRTSADSDCDDANEAKGTASADCDDADASISPGTAEVLDDGIDQDCDGLESCPVDGDGDGYAADGASVASSDLDCLDAGEASGSLPATDCDDAAASINPGATEILADGVDEDCDAAELCYDDDDNDGSIDTNGDTRFSLDMDCTDASEAGTDTPTTDCDDSDATIHDGATEIVGDGIDEDCDGKESCFDDDDDDGFIDLAGDARTSADTDCDDTSEAKSDAPTNDCDDANGAVYPGAAELPGDGIDEDCDGRELCPVDADGDGYADDAGTTVPTATLDCVGAGVVDASAPATDCDDAEAEVYPGAPEATADGVDQNCDGADNCYLDADRDGYGSTTVVAGDDLDCADASSAVASRSDDCDDSDAATYPSATEIVGDGIDEDCDGHEVCYVDADEDGVAAYGGTTIESEDADCVDAGEAGAEVATTDCDDADRSVGEEFWYIDADGDAYGDDATRRAMCDPGNGFVRVGGDCSDHDATVFPGTENYDQVCGDAGAACGCSSSGSGAARAWLLAAVASVTLSAARRRRENP